MVLAEKPSAARRIATSLAEGKPKKVKKGGVYYYRLRRNGEELVVAPAVGHLFGLTASNSSWNYPVFSTKWEPTYKKKGSKWTGKYLRNIERLSSGAKEFISATDYDREGSVISFNILRFVCHQENAKRMKFSTLTQSDLVEAFNKASEHLDFPQVEAGLARHYLDFFWGVNLSRALITALKEAGGYKTLSTGRVQGPTLKLLEDREREIEEFEPEPYWQLQLTGLIEEEEIVALHEEDKFWEKEKAEKIFNLCKDKDGTVSEVEKNRYKHWQPHPFDLTTLQREAYRCFKFSPKKTLDTAQILYEKGLCVSGDTLIPLPDGRLLTAGEIVEREIKQIMGVDKNLKTCPVNISDWIRLPSPETLKSIKLSNNDSLRLTEDHKVMVMRNGKIRWTKASELKNDDFIAVTDRLNISSSKKTLTILEVFDLLEKDIRENILILVKPELSKAIRQRLKEREFSVSSMAKIMKRKEVTVYKYFRLNRFPYHFIKWLIKNDIVEEEEIKNAAESYLLAKPGAGKLKLPFEIDTDFMYFAGLVAADGSLDGIHISFANIPKFEEVLKKYSDFFGRKLSKNKGGYYMSSSLLVKILNVLDIPTGKKSDKITINNVILKQRDSLIWAFLAGFFDGDGGVKLKLTGTGKSKTVRICFTSMSREFLSKLKLALLRFGINSYIYTYPEHSTKDAQDLLIYSDDFEAISEHMKKYLKIRLEEWEEVQKIYEPNKKYRHSSRLIPLFGEELKKHLELNNKLYKKFNLGNQTSKGKCIQKDVLSQLAEKVGDDFSKKLANGDLIWRKIKEIKDVEGDTFVFDVSTSTKNFIANGVVIHNCSYPRTSSQKLPPKIGYKKIMKKLKKQKKYSELSQKLLKRGYLKPNNGKKKDPAHPAVFPTGLRPKKINKDQQKLYDLIVKRFFSTFADPAIREKMKVTIQVEGENFISQGVRTIEKNWMNFYKPYARFKEQALPPVKKGQNVKNKELELLEKETQPPNRYSQSSILKKMESLSLGTKATRSTILQTLYDRNYITDRSIRVTELGKSVAKALENNCPEIISVELTKQFEEDMEKIREGKEDREKVIQQAKKTLKKILKEFKEKEKEIGKELLEGVKKSMEEERNIGKCKCGGDLMIRRSRKGKRFVGCSNYPECTETFSLPQNGKLKVLKEKCNGCGLPVIKVIQYKKRPWKLCVRCGFVGGKKGKKKSSKNKSSEKN